MPFEPTLIILGIGFVIWLVSNLYKNAEDARRRNEVAAGGERQRPRAAASEIDRFLEEIQRRRAQQVQRPPQGQAEGRQAIPEAMPVIYDQPKRAPKPPVQARPVPAKPVQARPVQARPTPRPTSARPIRAIPIPAFVTPTVAEPAISREFGSLSGSGGGDGIPSVVRMSTDGHESNSPALVDLLNILHSRKGVKQAMILGMILGPPRCKQRMRPGQGL